MSLLEVQPIDELVGLEEALARNAVDKDGNIKMLTLNKNKPDEKKVVYGPAITTGLNQWQIEKLKETVKNIRNVDGAYKLYVAKELHNLRGLLRGSKKGENPKQWTEFKRSGLVPFSAREIQDLCASYEWLKESGLEGAMLNTIGIRTMALIAGCDKRDVKKKAELMLMSGEQVTYKKVADMINPPIQKKQKVKLEYEAVLVSINNKMKSASWSSKKSEELIRKLTKENFLLKEAITDLKNPNN